MAKIIPLYDRDKKPEHVEQIPRRDVAWPIAESERTESAISELIRQERETLDSLDLKLETTRRRQAQLVVRLEFELWARGFDKEDAQASAQRAEQGSYGFVASPKLIEQMRAVVTEIGLPTIFPPEPAALENINPLLAASPEPAQ